MLIQFTVGNYKSFKDNVTFSMVASSLISKDKTIDQHNVFNAVGKLNLLKSAAIYGANASGKSNLVHAMRFMQNFVLNSSRETQAKDPIPVEPYLLSTETENAPSFFEIIFLLEGKKYRYGFEADSQKIHSEWFFYTHTKKETKLFTRENSTFALSNTFREGKDIDNKTRENALFLSVIAQFNGEIAQKILNWFRYLQVLSGLEDRNHFHQTVRSIQDQSLKSEVLFFLKNMDVGIEDVDLEKVLLKDSVDFTKLSTVMSRKFLKQLSEIEGLEEIKVRTMHKKFNARKSKLYNVFFDLNKSESEGTKKVFALAGTFCHALKHGQTVIIDELDARLHPLITQSIIRLFNSNETNPNNAQLIFTTHDTNLLSNKLFRRDQIWFTEKNKYGATDLYSLAEYKIRNDASYEKDYIAGKYGAIPFIGNLSFMENPTNGKKTKTLG